MKVIIDSGIRWTYFQWFILGFFELEKQGMIEFSINIPWYNKIRYFTPNNFLVRVLEKIFPEVDNDDAFNMRGRIIDEGNVYKFCIDSQDSPYIYDEDDLKDVDCYFKIQCPKNFYPKGFKLTDDVVIPWTNAKYSISRKNVRNTINNFMQYVYKIKPLMLGPRRLAFSSAYRCLKNGYDYQRKNMNGHKKGFLMCYFGNAKGPVPKVFPSDEIDVNKEDQILGKYGKKINHPNEKRAVAAEYMVSLRNEDIDARVVNNGNSDSNSKADKKDFIPYKKFSKHVSNFCYNLNVSGYRLSIPNRFIESFMVGTAILTDKLSVKWYKEFSDDEVKETVTMGYLPMEQVDWNVFKQDIASLPRPDNNRTIEAFYDKWSPIVVARYILDSVLEK